MPNNAGNPKGGTKKGKAVKRKLADQFEVGAKVRSTRATVSSKMKNTKSPHKVNKSPRIAKTKGGKDPKITSASVADNNNAIPCTSKITDRRVSEQPNTNRSISAAEHLSNQLDQIDRQFNKEPEFFQGDHVQMCVNPREEGELFPSEAEENEEGDHSTSDEMDSDAESTDSIKILPVKKLTPDEEFEQDL